MKGTTGSFLLLLTASAASRVGADAVAYSGVRDLRASGGNTVAEHHHDWKQHTAYVRILDAASGKKLLERPSPALTTLFVTPDGSYAVGLFLCSDPRLRGLPCQESASVAVLWYDEEEPGIKLVVQGGRPVALSVNELRDPACASSEAMAPAERKRLCPEPRRRIRLTLSE